MPEPGSANRTRRAFVQSAVAGVAAGGPTLNAAESLALSGGPCAVTVPPETVAGITKWPRYGADEKSALNALLDSNKWYAEIPLLEKELKAHLQVPWVKSHMNATSALMSMFFALKLEPGSEILAPSYTAWATTAPMHPVHHSRGRRMKSQSQSHLWAASYLNAARVPGSPETLSCNSVNEPSQQIIYPRIPSFNTASKFKTHRTQPT